MREPFCRARLYFTALLMGEVCLGLSIIIVTAAYHHILGAYMADMERKMLSGQFFNTYILGFQIVITYLCGMAMWKRLWLRRCTPNLRLLISCWMFFCFLIVLCGFGTIWSLFTCADALETTAETSLMKGIDMYYTCPEWKLLWDGLQYHKECCGVHGYRDWMRAAWMPAEAIQNDVNEEKCLPEDKRSTLAPYACCKHSCSACFENYIPRAGSSIPYLNMTQINTNGCLPMFTESMWCIMYILLGLVLIAFKMDLLICFMVKYILHKQENEGYGGIGCTDEEGRPMVVVKFPPTVRCVTVEEEEASTAPCSEVDKEFIMEPCSYHSVGS